MSPQQTDTIIGIVVIGVLFACIWVAAWIVSKILTIPVVLWRQSFQKEIVGVPSGSVTSYQNELESLSLKTRQSNPIVPASLESNDIIEARFPRHILKRQPKSISPIIRTDGTYPDSSVLTVTTFLHTPIRLSKPATTPLGGRSTVIQVLSVEVLFRVKANTLEIISGCLSRSAGFADSKAQFNVAAVRRGEAWLADYSLESEINHKLTNMLKSELEAESRFRRILWGRYFEWARDEKKLIY